jgi:antitoxin FitA
MTALLIRRIDDKLKRALRLRAAQNGRSMEEEMRQILRTALGVLSPKEEHERTLEEIEALAKVRYPTGGG